MVHGCNIDSMQPWLRAASKLAATAAFDASSRHATGSWAKTDVTAISARGERPDMAPHIRVSIAFSNWTAVAILLISIRCVARVATSIVSPLSGRRRLDRGEPVLDIERVDASLAQVVCEPKMIIRK